MPPLHPQTQEATVGDPMHHCLLYSDEHTWDMLALLTKPSSDLTLCVLCASSFTWMDVLSSLCGLSYCARPAWTHRSPGLFYWCTVDFWRSKMVSCAFKMTEDCGLILSKFDVLCWLWMQYTVWLITDQCGRIDCTVTNGILGSWFCSHYRSGRWWTTWD